MTEGMQFLLREIGAFPSVGWHVVRLCMHFALAIILWHRCFGPTIAYNAGPVRAQCGDAVNVGPNGHERVWLLAHPLRARAGGVKALSHT